MTLDRPGPSPDQRVSAEEALPGTCWDTEGRCGASLDVSLWYYFGVNENLTGTLTLEEKGEKLGLLQGTFDAVSPDAVVVDYEVLWFDGKSSTTALQHQLSFRGGAVVLPAGAIFPDCPQLTFQQRDCQDSSVAPGGNASDDSGDSDSGGSGADSD